MDVNASAFLNEDFSNDILLEMRGKEMVQMRPSHPDDSCYIRCRRTLVVWMLQVCEELEFTNGTAFQAIGLMDRVFVSERLNDASKQGSFQLIAMACIMIAAKLEEVDAKVPTLCYLNDLSDNTYTVRALQQAEVSILQFLQWNLHFITPICYMKYFLRKMATGIPLVDQETHTTVVLLLGLALQDHRFISYRPSLLCAACLACARHVVLQQHAVPGVPWDEHMAYAVDYKLQELEGCCGQLMEGYREFMGNYREYCREQQEQRDPQAGDDDEQDGDDSQT